jgi:hypothetical protein
MYRQNCSDSAQALCRYRDCKQYGPLNKVSRLRYQIGLVMFCVPILFGWLSIYTAGYIPAFAQNPFPYALGRDLLLLAGLLVLGGDFWDKIRSLFIHNAEVRFAQTPKKEIL